MMHDDRHDTPHAHRRSHPNGDGAHRADTSASNGSSRDPWTEPDDHENPIGMNAGVRIIVVGRTELIPRLRLRRGVELIRAQDGSAAIAELASPIDDTSPASCVVLVGRTSDPADHDAHEFNAALRRVNNTVHTVAVNSAITNPRDPAAFDETLDEHLSDEALDSFLARAGGRNVIGTDRGNGSNTASSPSHRDAAQSIRSETPDVSARSPGTTQAPHTKPAKPTATTMPATIAHAVPAEPGAGPLAALLGYKDVLQPALDAVRLACSPHAVHFTAGTADELPPDVERVAPVVCKGKRLGWLGSPSLDAATLETHAQHLGAWIVLGRRQRALRRAACTDPLTGAYNRRYFDRFLARAIERARDGRHTVAVLLFDLDNFKTFNDRFGHHAGDNILIHTVRLLRSVIRPTDRVCRIGGDEFVVIFTNPDGPRDPASKPLTPESIKELAKRFQRQISSHRFPHLGSLSPGELSISGGLATFPWDGSDAETLIRRADQLAMRCKSAGKNLIDFGPGAERAD